MRKPAITLREISAGHILTQDLQKIATFYADGHNHRPGVVLRVSTAGIVCPACGSEGNDRLYNHPSNRGLICPACRRRVQVVRVVDHA